MKYVQQGITLLEVMIAVAIVGIVSAIALPSLTPMLQSDRANNFVDELGRTVKFARTKATTADEFIVVCPIENPTTGGQCTNDWGTDPIVAFVDKGKDLNLNNSDDLLLRVMTTPNIKDNVIQLKGASAITIDGQGRVNKEHQFVICPNGESKNSSSLQISVSGNTWKLGKQELNCSSA